MCSLLIGNCPIFAQQTSTVSDTVSISGINSPSPGRLQIDPNASALDSTINPYNISVPEQFGQIEEVFQGDATSPLIVHVQNVHANYEAQVNIKNILNHLVNQYQFSLIQLEGAVSKLDPTILQPSYLKEANLKLVDFLMRDGRITGADAFAVETDKSVEMYGIEDYSLYMENLKMFKIIYKHQEDLKPYFDEIHRLILTVGPKLLNPESLDFTRKTEEFSTDKIDLMDYLIYMNKLSEKLKLASLNDLSEMINYPNLTRLMRLRNLEEELNKAGLKKETEAIKLEFKKKMPDSIKVDELLSRLDESAKGTNPRDYFLELTKMADEAKIDFIAYPAFRIFAEFLIHQDEIDHRSLFSELKEFEQMLQAKLFTSEDEKMFLSIIDYVGLLEQFFRLEMSREKIALYLKDRDAVKPSRIFSSIEELAKKNNIVAKPVGDLEKLDSYMSDVEYFYQLVLKRDEVFIDKILSKTKSLSLDKTIIVTGGFHKDALVDHFRKNKISYVIINPKVDVKEGNQNYLKVMLDEEAVAGSVFAGTFALEIISFIDELLRSNPDRANDLELTAKLYAATIALTRTLSPQLSEAEFIKLINQVPTEVSGVKFIVEPAEPGELVRLRVGIILTGEERQVSGYRLTATFNSETGQFDVRKLDKQLKPSEIPIFTRSRPVRPVSSPIDRNTLVRLENAIVTTEPESRLPLIQQLEKIFSLLSLGFIAPAKVPIYGGGDDEKQQFIAYLQELASMSIAQLIQLGRAEGVPALEEIRRTRTEQRKAPVTDEQIASVPDKNISMALKYTNQKGTVDDTRFLAFTLSDDRALAKVQMDALEQSFQTNPKLIAVIYGKDETSDFVRAVSSNELFNAIYVVEKRDWEDALPAKRKMYEDVKSGAIVTNYISTFDGQEELDREEAMTRLGVVVDSDFPENARQAIATKWQETLVLINLNKRKLEANNRLNVAAHFNTVIIAARITGLKADVLGRQLAEFGLLTAMKKIANNGNQWGFEDIETAVAFLVQFYDTQRALQIAA